MLNANGQVMTRDEMRCLADGWNARFEHELREIISAKTTDTKTFINAIFERGILESCSPTDDRVRTARTEMGNGRCVWEGREEVALYWRILYDIGYYKYATAKCLSVMSDGVSAPIFAALLAAHDRRKEFFPESKDGNRNKQWSHMLLRALSERTMTEIRKRGGIPHDPLIPWRASGLYKGLAVTNVRYVQGRIWLDGTTPAAHMQLFDLNAHQGVCASELDPKSFTAPTDEF